ncbi:MAG: M23 family metallopeptidase [Candidatus Entotheonellia bacterium]
MKHRLFWVVCVGFVFGLGLGQPSVGGDQNVIYAKGRWTRLLEGEWYVRGVSKAPEVAHLFRDYRRQTPEERLLKFGNPFDCFSRFTAEEVKVLHLPTMSLREGRVHYRESGNQNDKIRFVLIEPGAAILLYDQWRSALSPNGRRIVYIHGARGVLEDRSRSLDIVEVFSPQGGVYSSVETSRQITPGPERGESVLAFEAYKSLLFNEGLGEGDEDSGIPWPVWLVSVVGWASDTEVLYLSHRTTDLQHAWLTKDKDWLAKKRWSLWRMPVTDRVEPEQLVWDSQTPGEQVLEVRVLPHLQLLVETHDHILVIDREGRTGMTLAKADIGLVGFVWSALAQENDEFDAAILAEDDVYSYTAPLAGQITFRSPLRNADGSDNFAPVTSKNGQPRTTGSNPHIGVDLQPKAGESKDVYPVRNGRVYWVDTIKYGRVTIQLDVNGDGQYELPIDNLFVTYLHMRNIAVVKDQNVAIDTKVGEVSNLNPTPILVHLHFEINTITGGSDCRSDFRLPGCTVIRMHRYYEGLIAAQWSGGRDFDFITDIAWRDSRIADTHVYAMNNGAYEDVREGDVILFHRQQGAAVWNSAPMNKNGDLFFLILSQFYPSGTQLELYGRATRTGIPRQPTSLCDGASIRYNYSFMQPRRHRPAPCDIDPQDIFHVLLVY